MSPAGRGRAPNRRAMEAAAPLLTGDCRRSRLARDGSVGDEPRGYRRMAVLLLGIVVRASPYSVLVHSFPRPPAASLCILFCADASVTVSHSAART